MRYLQRIFGILGFVYLVSLAVFNNPWSMAACTCSHERRDHVFFTKDCGHDDCMCKEFTS